MAFLTIFTAPKPFTDPHIKIIQRNAIQSWMHLQDVTVMLIGDEPGLLRLPLSSASGTSRMWIEMTKACQPSDRS